LGEKEKRRAWGSFTKAVVMMANYPSKIGWKIIADMTFEGVGGKTKEDIAKLPMQFK
jgi:hypothetical protein